MSTPDLGLPVKGQAVTLYPSADGVGPYTAVPTGLRLAVDAAGAPEFHLALVRSSAVVQLQYGVLDMRLEAFADLDDAGSLLANRDKIGAIEPVLLERGMLSMTGAVPSLPIGRIEPLQFNGLGVLRLTHRLDPATAVLAAELLESETVPIKVVLDAEFRAAAPRVPIRVGFDPMDLFDQIREPLVEWHALGSLFTDALRQRQLGLNSSTLSSLSIEGAIDTTEPSAFGTAMAARVRRQWGSFASSPPGHPVPHIVLTAPAAGAELAHWDLSDLERTFAPITLELGVPESLVDELRRGGIDQIRSFVDAPPLRTGFRSVTLSGNLPARRDDFTLGVRIRKAATAQRPMPIDQSITFTSPRDQESVVLQLSPSESVEIDVSTFADLDQPQIGFLHHFEGTSRSTSESTITIGIGDYPLQFVSIEALQTLLDQVATIQLAVSWRNEQSTGTSYLQLDSENSRRTLALPDKTILTEFSLLATAGDGRTAFRVLSGLPEGPIGRELFPSFGINEVGVECQLGDTERVLAIELLPEGRADSEANRTLLIFTPDALKKTYRWFNASVFRSGYRYRRLRLNNSPDEWSSIQASDGSLLIASTEGASGRGT